MDLVLITLGVACTTGTVAVVGLGRVIVRNRRRIDHVEQCVAQLNRVQRVVSGERARHCRRHGRGLIVLPAIWLARRALQPQVAAAVTALAIAGGGAAAVIDPPREPGMVAQPSDRERHHARLTIEPPAEPVAATQPAGPSQLEDPRIIRQESPAPALTTPTTAPPQPAPEQPLVTTTTVTVPPRELIALGETEEDCVVDLGGLGVGLNVGLVCP